MGVSFFSEEIHLSWPLVGAGASRSSIKKQATAREHCKSHAFEKFQLCRGVINVSPTSKRTLESILEARFLWVTKLISQNSTITGVSSKGPSPAHLMV